MKSNNESTLSLDTIIAATQHGDCIAIEQIMQHYKDYVAVLASRKHYGGLGKTHTYVDEELSSRLENKLISAILDF